MSLPPPSGAIRLSPEALASAANTTPVAVSKSRLTFRKSVVVSPSRSFAAGAWREWTHSGSRGLEQRGYTDSDCAWKVLPVRGKRHAIRLRRHMIEPNSDCMVTQQVKSSFDARWVVTIERH